MTQKDRDKHIFTKEDRPVVHDREAELKSIRTDFKRAALEGRVIDISPLLSPAQGDKFIQTWALREAITVMCHFSPQQKEKIRFAYNSTNRKAAKFGRELYFNFSRIRHESMNALIVHEYLDSMARLLDVKIPQTIYDMTPVPFRFEDVVFGSFDMKEAKKRAAKIKESLQGKKLITIFQAGSILNKRFTDDQIKEIAETLRTKYKNAIIYVVTDGGKIIRGSNQNTKGETLHNVSDIDDCVTVTDLTDVSAYALASDMVVTTDTLWSWWAGGSISLKEDHIPGKIRDDELVELNSVAGKKFQVPGSTAMFSEATNKLEPEWPILTMTEYEDFFPGSNGCISKKDITRFKKVLESKKLVQAWEDKGTPTSRMTRKRSIAD